MVVGTAADADQQLVAHDLGAVVDRQHDRSVGTFAPHRGRVDAGMHFDALRGEGGAHLLARERLFASEQPRPALDDGDLLAARAA